MRIFLVGASRAFAATALTALAVPAAASAQGFGLNEIGTCTVGRTSAVTAAPCEDASAIFWNPAAAVRLRGLTLYLGASSVGVKGSFTQDSTATRYPGDVPVEFPPAAFLNYRWSDRIALGVGAYVPYGLTSQWNQDFPGRFSAQKASLATVYVQPNLAIDLVPGRFSIGGGPIFGHSSVELNQGIDLSQQVAAGSGATAIRFGQLGIRTGTEFARARLKGSATGWGFQVGAHASLTPSWQLGARYLSKIAFDYDDADATFDRVATGLSVSGNPNPFGVPAGTPLDTLLSRQFQSGGALVSQKVRTAIDHPAQAQVGLAYTGFARTTLEFDYEWVDWSAFKELPVEFQGPASGSNRVLIEDYEDASIFRVSADHRFVNDWALRAGFSYNKAPSPDASVTPLLPDMDRFVFGAGTSIPLAGAWSLDASYLRVETEGRRGRIVERASRSETAERLNSGWYSLNANIFSVGLRARFF